MSDTPRAGKGPATDDHAENDTNDGLPFETDTPSPRVEDSAGLDEVDPAEQQRFIQNVVQDDLQPTVDDLVSAPVLDDVDGADALAKYLLRAAETGANAESCLEFADQLHMPREQQEVLQSVRDLLWSTAAWVSTGRARYLDDMTSGLEAAGDAITEIAESPLEVTLPEVDTGSRRDDKWTKHAASASGHVTGGHISQEWSPIDDDVEDITGCVEISDYANGGQVALTASSGATVDGVGIDQEICCRLTPEQAEALAASLVERAETVRETRDDD